MSSIGGYAVRGLSAAVLALLGVGCGQGGDAGRDGGAVDAGADGGADARCPWGVDALLAAVGVAAPERVDCGSFNGADTARISDAFDCLTEAVDAGKAVELTINRCIDCSIPTTYVATASGEAYAVLMEEDAFGDDQREAVVERCDAITLDDSPTVRCSLAAELYRCEEPR